MRTSCEDISSVHKMRENEDFSSFLKKKPSSNAEVTHSEKGKQLAVLAPTSFRLRVGVWLWIWPQRCRSCLLPPSAAQQTCSGLFSLLMPCHFVQYSSFKHAQILFGPLASSQGFLVFCLSCSKPIGLLSFLPLFCFSTCFCTIYSTGLPDAG